MSKYFLSANNDPFNRYYVDADGKKMFLDSEGGEHPQPEISSKKRTQTESPYDCAICGEPANSPAYKRYCWKHYDTETNGKVFD